MNLNISEEIQIYYFQFIYLNIQFKISELNIIIDLIL